MSENEQEVTIKDIAENVLLIIFIFLVGTFMPDFILEDVGISRNTWGWIWGILLVLLFIVLFLQILIYGIKDIKNASNLDGSGKSDTKKPSNSTQQDQSGQIGKRCPDCDRPMRWIEQYNRWYCESCNQYKSIPQPQNQPDKQKSPPPPPPKNEPKGEEQPPPPPPQSEPNNKDNTEE